MAQAASVPLSSPHLAQGTEPDLAVRLHGVDKSYDGRQILRSLALEVREGEFLAILGPSGSGKTTVMRLIGGFETADAGHVQIGGVEVTGQPPEARPVNTVFQSYALFPHMTVRDNVAFGPRMKGMSKAARRAKADRMLKVVRLDHMADSHPGNLSGGMQQRVALARALASDPEVLLLDEPLGALDRKLRDHMQRELRRVQSELGATFVYVTHDQEEAFGMADRIAVMKDGVFIQIAPPAEVYDQPASLWVARFVGTVNMIDARVTALKGEGAVLESPLGRIEVGWIAPELSVGDTATVAVRPESTLLRPGAPMGDVVNAWPARLADSVMIGANSRLSARAADGTDFEAIVQRAGHANFSGHVGDAVIVTFERDAARAYVPEQA